MGPGKYDTTYLLALLASPAPYAPVLSCLVTISVRALIQVLALYPFAFGFDSDDVEPLFMLTFMSPSPIFRHTLRLKPTSVTVSGTAACLARVNSFAFYEHLLSRTTI